MAGARRCQQAGAFAQRDDPAALAYRPTVRPDGHGIWIDHDVAVPFFVEIDLSTEPLSRLVEKIGHYVDLARLTGVAWPVLFTLQSASREQHLHQQLTADGIHWRIATTVRPRLVGYRADVDRSSPASTVWWSHRHQGALVRLADLAVPT